MERIRQLLMGWRIAQQAKASAMNVKSMDIRDMIWMENSEFQDDWYGVIFMGI